MTSTTSKDMRFHSDSSAIQLVLLLLIALFLMGRTVYLYLADVYRFPLTNVKIAASYEHISHRELVSVIAPYLSMSYFMMPSSQLSSALKKMDWVAEVSIDKVWPDTLKIKISEKKPIAFFNHYLLMADASIIKKEASIQDEYLPEFIAPDNEKTKILQNYKKLSKILKAADLSLTRLELSKNQAWTLQLRNGTKVRLGKTDIEKKLTRFCKAYPALVAENNTHPASVDLRYPRAMAVRWT